MNHQKILKINQLIQIIFLIITFTLLFGKYYDLKINSYLGIFSYIIIIILALSSLFITIKELIKKREFLPFEITYLANTIVIIIISTTFLIVYFILKNI